MIKRLWENVVNTKRKKKEPLYWRFDHKPSWERKDNM